MTHHLERPARPRRATAADATATHRPSRAIRSVGAGLVLLVLGAAACSGQGAPTATPGAEASTETLAPFVADEAGGVAEPCTGAGDSGGAAGGSPPAATGSPLASPGARQLPGPGVTVTAVPSSATSILMQTPANPDEASPARQPDGVGIPTAPYVIDGPAASDGGSTATPSTTPADADDPEADPSADDPPDAAGAVDGCGGGL